MVVGEVLWPADRLGLTAIGSQFCNDRSSARGEIITSGRAGGTYPNRGFGSTNGVEKVDPSPRRLEHNLDKATDLLGREDGRGELVHATAGDEDLGRLLVHINDRLTHRLARSEGPSLGRGGRLPNRVTPTCVLLTPSPAAIGRPTPLLGDDLAMPM